MSRNNKAVSQEERTVTVNGVLAKAGRFVHTHHIVVPEDHNLCLGWYLTKHLHPVPNNNNLWFVPPDYCVVRPVNGHVMRDGVYAYYVNSIAHGGTKNAVYDARMCKRYHSDHEARSYIDHLGPFSLRKM